VIDNKLRPQILLVGTTANAALNSNHSLHSVNDWLIIGIFQRYSSSIWLELLARSYLRFCHLCPSLVVC